ncbi:MAG: hypothetical protein GC206_08000 [Alphaproteobacteria bacterium]|nr:hypothetical protein [Alphaproteobacteria bacterium]
MIRTALVHTKSRESVLAAARKIGLECRFHPYSASHLERLKQPALLIFDTDAVEHLTPALLQALRRDHVTGVRHSPALALCRTRSEAGAWRDAGAVAALRSSTAETLARAMREALAGADDWVTSKAYVGPSRRKRAPILKLRTRRAGDYAAKARAGAGAAPTASLGVIARRLHLGAALLSGSSLENRQAFLALAQELARAIVLQHRPDLAMLARAIQDQAQLFLKDEQRSTAILDALVAELAQKL